MKTLITTCAAAALLAASANAAIIFTEGFERATGTTIGNGWIEDTGDSRLFANGNLGSTMPIEVTTGENWSIVNNLADTFTAGTTYTLAFEGDRASKNPGTLNYTVQIGTWDGLAFTELANVTDTMAVENDQVNNTDQLVYAATLADAGAQIAIRFARTGGDNFGGFDNITLDAATVPEPSSTALLGLGGLALILRRRK